MDSNILNIKSLVNKFPSKHEMYKFIKIESGIHLPPQKECSIYFVRDILNGTKRVTIGLLTYLI